MEDNQIISLYWQRDQRAITETAEKYGGYCYRIAYNILNNREDSEESVNDTYMGAWNAMPPHRPSILSTFLGKITRRISLNKWRNQNRKKRGGGEVILALEELQDCVASEQDVAKSVEQKELSAAIRTFLSRLPDTERDIFVCRYWFMASVSEIGQKFQFSESKVKSVLMRTRGKLRRYLQEEEML